MHFSQISTSSCLAGLHMELCTFPESGFAEHGVQLLGSGNPLSWLLSGHVAFPFWQELCEEVFLEGAGIL